MSRLIRGGTGFAIAVDRRADQHQERDPEREPERPFRASGRAGGDGAPGFRSAGTAREGSPPPHALRERAARPSGRWRAARIGRTLIGAMLLGLGIVMLVLPAPGAAFIAAGALLLGLPVPGRVAAWFQARPKLAALVIG
jgi:hypothetical protein